MNTDLKNKLQFLPVIFILCTVLLVGLGAGVGMGAFAVNYFKKPRLCPPVSAPQFSVTPMLSAQLTSEINLYFAESEQQKKLQMADDLLELISREVLRQPRPLHKRPPAKASKNSRPQQLLPPHLQPPPPHLLPPHLMPPPKWKPKNRG